MGKIRRLRCGTPSRDVPPKCGNWNTIYRRFRRWNEAGVWEAVALTLSEAMAGSGDYSIDSPMLRAHISAAGGKGEAHRPARGRPRGGFTSKFHCLTDALGPPIAFHLNVGELWIAKPMMH